MKKTDNNTPEEKSKNASENKPESLALSDSEKSPVANSRAKKNVVLKEPDKADSTKSEMSPAKTITNKKIPLYIAIGIVFLIAVSATGLAIYDFWLLRAQAPINAQLADAQNGLEARINQLAKQSQGLEQQSRNLEQQLKNTKDQLFAEIQARKNEQSEHQAVNAALQNITEKLGRNTIAWRMAEVEYLLTIANHRLTLAQDRQTAMSVLETADNRLEIIADPVLLKVRKEIASELTALRAMPNVDIPGLALQIGSLAESVEQLPLRDKKRLTLASESRETTSSVGWEEIPAVVWSDIKNLVQVRRHQQPTEPLLPPQQAWFLYQNLQLKLEQARLAVLKQNTAVFAQSLEEVSQWLNGYFEVKSAAVGNMQETVKNLRTIELQPAVPDISGSLRELRVVMNARSRMNPSLEITTQ